MINSLFCSKVRCLLSLKRSKKTVIQRAKHNISRRYISPNALKVLYRLKNAGHAAYLVGGGVRDLLLGQSPKDFDVVTDGDPHTLRAIFSNSRIIGRRFRLLHVFFFKETIEVSTFRAHIKNKNEATDLKQKNRFSMLMDDNVYGTIEEDAWRRDFTINALYYNLSNFSIIDYTGGLSDLKRRTVRIIGNPVQRFHEDPVRLLRAIRLAAKLNFNIHSRTASSIQALSSLLHHISNARLLHEVIKLFFEGNATISYQYLEKYGYIIVLFPSLGLVLQGKNKKQWHCFLNLSMQSMDERFQRGASLSLGFLLSVLLWPVLRSELDKINCHETRFHAVLHRIIDKILDEQERVLRIPRRFTIMTRSIWILQYRLLNCPKRAMHRHLHHHYFQAAFDFLILRVRSGEPLQKQVEKWSAFQKEQSWENTVY